MNNFRYGITRQGFSQIGDNTHNQVSFRFVFEPTTNNPSIFTLSRTTPVHNIVDDVSWIKNKHTIQFGTNLRFVRNNRVSFANAFDFAQTNPSGYQAGGEIISNAVAEYLNSSRGLNNLISTAEAQNAATSLIGRYSQYNINLIYGHDGKLLTAGSPSDRTFATQAYDFYVQDSWKATRDLTVSFGLRYGLTQPVYETHGFEVKPNIPLSDYFRMRVDSAANGIPLNTPITMELSGPKNGKSNMYPRDYRNFQPRVGVAWAPNFENPALKAVFGGAGKSAIRGGFSVFSDYFGEALATFFDLNNALGFSSSARIPVNTYNITDKPAPLFTSLNQDVRTLPNLTFSKSISFPQQQPANMGERIESSLDSKLQTPKAYTFSLTVERQLPSALVFQASYVGRLGRHLLAQRDAMALNNLVDPKSGMDWYGAATALEKIRQVRAVVPNRPRDNFAVPTMAYFDNIFPANLRDVMNAFEGLCATPTSPCIPAGFTPTQTIFWIARNTYANDWTDLQADLDLARFNKGQSTLFFNPQYGALTAWSTIGNSNYHGLALSLRQRQKNLQWDFNYTFAHSLDDSSGLQSSAGFAIASFILNPIRQRDWYASSSFDLRHVINSNAIYQLPFGRGQLIGGNAGRALDAIIGGWQLSGIFRWNTGLPLNAPIDDARWATNWQVQSRTVLTRPISPCITRDNPKLFGCNTKDAYQSFRNAYPGESGMRNAFRLPGYIDVDTGLSKSFSLPWNENHKLQLRWEVFNATNTQHFGATDLSRSGWGIRPDPGVRNLNPPANWSNFTDIQGGSEFGRRTMQVGLRYSF